MADPLSIALGVLQVADTGAKLASGIYSYIDRVRKAEKELRPIADYVNLTSIVLWQVSSHLQDATLTAFVKPALLASTQDALQGCETVFGDLEAYLRSVGKIAGRAWGGSSGITMKAKLAWPWKQSDLERQQVRLERHKSGLDLLLSTLTLISATRAAENTEGIKLDLQRLMLVKAKAVRRDVDLSTSIDSLPVSEKALDDSTRAIGIMTASVIPEAAKVESTLQALPAPENMPKGPLQQAEEHLLGSLHECAKAVSVLSTALERAITKLSASEGHTPACLQTDFHNLQAAFNRMTWQESALRMHQDAQSTVASISGSANEGIAANTKSLQNTGLPAGSIVLEQAPTSAHSAARAPTAITSETRRTKLVPDREMDRVSSNTYYPHGDRQPLPIPTEDEEEYFDWGPTETEKPRKREAKACLSATDKFDYDVPLITDFSMRIGGLSPPSVAYDTSAPSVRVAEMMNDQESYGTIECDSDDTPEIDVSEVDRLLRDWTTIEI